jgi:two-component system nitrate/nitrite response regulator NarL
LLEGASPVPPPAHPIRVVVADDDAEFRAAALAVLAADPRFEVVGETETGLGLADLAAHVGAHLVVVDVRMPHGGAEAVAALRQHTTWGGGDAPLVCALSGQLSVPSISAVVAAGATGFLAKGAIGGHLADLLARCARGEVVLAVPNGAEALRHVVGSAVAGSAGPDA